MSVQIPEDDREVIAAVVEELDPEGLLEFGPGESTYLFLELGLPRIVTCEYQGRWMDRARREWAEDERVELCWFTNEVEVEMGASLGQFDLAFVDSPVGDRRRVKLEGQKKCSRLNTTLKALECAPVVLLHDAHRPGEQHTLERVREAGHAVHVHETEKGIARIDRC